MTTLSMNKVAGAMGFEHSIGREPDNIGALKTNLSRLLRSMDMVGWSRHEESGRLDRKALSRYATGSAAIFSRREHKEAETASVSILIDCSGSMCARMQVAQDATICLSRILDKARVDFSVTGFTTGDGCDYVGGRTLSGREMNHEWEERALFIPFKRWGDSLTKSAPALGQICRFALSGTPDYAALISSLLDLSNRESKKKILFVITDAEGYSKNQMDQVQKTADKLGITICAIGIGTSDVKIFKHHAVIHRSSDLGGASLQTMLKAVKS